MIRLSHIYSLGVAALLLLAAAGCRRPLYVAGDEYYSAILHTDWSAYQRFDPDGMTTWFYPADDSSPSSRYTTSNVRYLPFSVEMGRYHAVVIDYSPQEYGRQEFIGMGHASTALVQATIAGAQPDSTADLYGSACWHKSIGAVNEKTGLYLVSNQPESMALDTLWNMDILGGEYGYYIPYKVRDTYESTLEIQDFFAYPVSPIWELRIRIYVKGLSYLYDIESSVAGLANGRFLALNHPAETPCLLQVTNWDTTMAGEKDGYISATVKTFGLMDSQRPHKTVRAENKESESAVIVDWSGTQLLRPEDIRLNLRLLLRDHATVMYFHYDVGEHIVSYDDYQILQLDLGRDFPDIPDLPYVEPFNSAGFDAEVTPWQDAGNADISM